MPNQGSSSASSARKKKARRASAVPAATPSKPSSSSAAAAAAAAALSPAHPRASSPPRGKPAAGDEAGRGNETPKERKRKSRSAGGGSRARGDDDGDGQEGGAGFSEPRAAAAPVPKRRRRVPRSSAPSPAEGGSGGADSPFRELTVRLYAHLAPCFVGRTMLGINEHLNSFLMRYNPRIDGVVLQHSNVKYLQPAGRIMYDSPYSHFWVQARLLVWRPSKNLRQVGKVTIQSPSHIGLLLYGTFNASIPAEEIPEDEYEWAAEAEDGTGSQGEWVNRSTGAAVNSDASGSLEFIVSDLTKANNMLTVKGTLRGL